MNNNGKSSISMMNGNKLPLPEFSFLFIFTFLSIALPTTSVYRGSFDNWYRLCCLMLQWTASIIFSNELIQDARFVFRYNFAFIMNLHKIHFMRFALVKGESCRFYTLFFSSFVVIKTFYLYFLLLFVA